MARQHGNNTSQGILESPERQLPVQRVSTWKAGGSLDTLGEDAEGEVEHGLVFSSEQLA